MRMSLVLPADPFVELCALLAELAAEAGDPLAPEVVQARCDVYRFLVDSGWAASPRAQALLNLDQLLLEHDLEAWSSDAALRLIVVAGDASRCAQLRRQLESSSHPHVHLVGEALDPGEAALVAAYARPHVVLVDAALPEAQDLAQQLGSAATSTAVVDLPLAAPEETLGEVLRLRPLAAPPRPTVPDLARADPDAARAATAAERDLCRVARPLDATRRLVAFVQELGGDLAPAQEQDRALLHLDLSFAQGPPVLPRAEPYSLARLRLELHLPPLVEVARRALAAGAP